MSLRPILRWPDPRLSETCAPVTGDISELSGDMLETMYAARGRGLAAPQIGVLRRLFVMDVGWKEGTPTPLICVNPEIVERSERQIRGPEGCLSIPGVTAQVMRAEWIVLRWTDAGGTGHQAQLDGFAAICAQHEYDHLDGIVTFDRVEPAARAALEADYAG
ncbi:peptide deformylase [Rhodophyticola porphyridii]|uniref:peptide deformylase n=1 Tax=Rhodophyticola porphyridii TaxID=1852017 RepID=UPI0035D08570